MTDPNDVSRTREGELARDGDLALRRLRDDDPDLDRLVRWRNEPHVAEFWVTDGDPVPFTRAHADTKYGPRTEPTSRTTACVITVGDRPAGYLQFYRWTDYPDDAEGMEIPVDATTFGLDIFVGEPDLVGSGVGSAAVDLCCRYLFDERGATRVALLTEVTNHRAQRAYEKAGMRKVRQALDTDTRGGERIVCWLMVRERAHV